MDERDRARRVPDRPPPPAQPDDVLTRLGLDARGTAQAGRAARRRAADEHAVWPRGDAAANGSPQPWRHEVPNGSAAPVPPAAAGPARSDDPPTPGATGPRTGRAPGDSAPARHRAPPTRLLSTPTPAPTQPARTSRTPPSDRPAHAPADDARAWTRGGRPAEPTSRTRDGRGPRPHDGPGTGSDAAPLAGASPAPVPFIPARPRPDRALPTPPPPGPVRPDPAPSGSAPSPEPAPTRRPTDLRPTGRRPVDDADVRHRRPAPPPLPPVVNGHRVPPGATRDRPTPAPFVTDGPSGTNNLGPVRHRRPTPAASDPPSRADRGNGVGGIETPVDRLRNGRNPTGAPRGARATPPPRPANDAAPADRPTAPIPRVRAGHPTAAGRADPSGPVGPSGNLDRPAPDRRSPDGRAPGTRAAGARPSAARHATVDARPGVDSRNGRAGAAGPRPADRPAPRTAHSSRTPAGRPTPAGHATPAGDRTALGNRTAVGDQSTSSGRHPDGTRSEGTRSEGTQQISKAERARRIDATLTRLTAAHAGVVLDRADSNDPADDDPADNDPAGNDPADRDRSDGAARSARRRPGRAATAGARRRPSVVRLLAVVAVVAVVLVAGAGWAVQQWLASGMQTVEALDPDSSAIIDPAAQLGADNILLVSTAAATDATRSPGAGSVALVHIPAGGSPIVVLTLPEQLELGRPACARVNPAAGPDLVAPTSRTSPAGALTLGGPRCLTQVVQQLTGLAVTRYVGLDLDAIGIAVDSASGVAVCVPRPVVDARLGPVAPTTGPRSLDGRAAADYVHAADVSGDPADGQGPITRQQQVLAAVLGGTLSDTGLLDVSRVASVRATLGPALVTDRAGLDQVLALARSLSSPDTADVTFRVVPSTPDVSGSGVVPLTADAKTLFDAVRTGAALPATVAASTAPAPADVHVDILNASSHSGQAARTGVILSGLGFDVGTVTNAAQPTPETLIRFSPDQTNAANLLAASVPAAAQIADPGAHGELQLVLGSSFDSVVKAPSTQTAPAPAPDAAPAVACA